MTRLIEDLKAAGWVETTLGECRVEEEVLLTPDGPFPRAVRLVQPPEWGGEKRRFVNTSDGGARLGTTPVLRPPRPEYAPGTVAMIRWREDQPPVRAWKKHGRWILPGSMPAVEDDGVEVVRVLLPADQDTPTVEVTDKMVERAAEAFYHGRGGEPGFGPQWDAICADWPEIATVYRRAVRAALESALGGGES